MQLHHQEASHKAVNDSPRLHRVRAQLSFHALYMLEPPTSHETTWFGQNDTQLGGPRGKEPLGFLGQD